MAILSLMAVFLAVSMFSSLLPCCSLHSLDIRKVFDINALKSLMHLPTLKYDARQSLRRPGRGQIHCPHLYMDE